jgi:hypothetical protein
LDNLIVATGELIGAMLSALAIAMPVAILLLVVLMCIVTFRRGTRLLPARRSNATLATSQ